MVLIKCLAVADKSVRKKKTNIFFRSAHSSTEYQMSHQPELSKQVGLSLGPQPAGYPPAHQILSTHGDTVNHQSEKKQQQLEQNRLLKKQSASSKKIAIVSFQG